MITKDKRKFAVCIASKDTRYFKHLDTKKCPSKCEKCEPDDSCIPPTGEEKALKEAQRLANKTGKKITVLTSVYNVYPDKKVEEVVESDNI